MKYNLITVEGNTGAGKTTLANMLAEEYGGELILEEFVDNPFLPKFYKEPQRYAFTTELYFMADRFHQLKQLLQTRDIFNPDKRYFTDYIFNKSLLYAKVNLEEDEYQLFARLFRIMYAEIPEPQLLIYVHSEVDRLVRNIQKRGRGFEQSVRTEYLASVEKIYFEYFKQNPQLRVLVLNTTEIDFVHKPEDFQRIQEVVTREYEPGTHIIHF